MASAATIPACAVRAPFSVNAYNSLTSSIIAETAVFIC